MSDVDKDKGYAVDFLSLALHAVSRDPEAYPVPCIYALVFLLMIIGLGIFLDFIKGYGHPISLYVEVASLAFCFFNFISLDETSVCLCPLFHLSVSSYQIITFLPYKLTPSDWCSS